ncbi:MAG: HdeD family acid-resistance protein [Thermoguttaceae bacterium]
MSSGRDDAVEVVAVATASERRVGHELQHLRSSWCWMLLLGILLVVCGTTALVFPIITSVAAINVLAVVLMIAGVATIIGSFWIGKWSGILVHLLVGILYLAAGFVVTERPLVSILMVTIFVAISFMVMGAFRILAALLIRFPQWGWALLNGTMTFLAGLVIYRHLPVSALWVIGLLVGLEMLLNGWTWMMLSLELRRIPK